MIFRRNKNEKHDKIKGKLVGRLRNSTSSEVIRWMDNVVSGTGLSIRDMQKNLNQNNPEQALVYIDEIVNGALSLLAAAQVMEERINPLQQNI